MRHRLGYWRLDVLGVMPVIVLLCLLWSSAAVAGGSEALEIRVDIDTLGFTPQELKDAEDGEDTSGRTMAPEDVDEEGLAIEDGWSLRTEEDDAVLTVPMPAYGVRRMFLE